MTFPKSLTEQEARFRNRLREAIREAREREGWTQRALALHLGWSQSRVAHHETGRGSPRTHDLFVLLQLLKIDPFALLDKKERTK